MNEFEEYRLRWRGRESGPFPLAEINRQLDDHEIGLSHEIFHRDDWMTLEDFFKPAPPPPATPPPPPPEAKKRTIATPAPLPITPILKPKRRLIFGLLAVLAGYIGLHNFYARQWLTGLLQLLLSVATFLLGFGILASWLWAVIEAVAVHKDGEGIEMI